MKEYNHGAIEKKWQQMWKKKKAFKTKDPGEKSAKLKKKFYVLDMFPYPSGEGLHVGHPKGYIATDIISRMKRMQGFNVLHPMGFDAFGLPAENYAIKTKTHPAIAVAKNISRYKKQLEIIGLDYDWSREVITTDPKFYKWTQWIFLKLLENGLAYESNEPVNWCPVDKTILANEDVEDGRCERCGSLVEKRPIRQWVLAITKYADRLLEDLNGLDWPEYIKESQRNWIGKSEGAEIDFEVSKNPQKIKVFTTRPDTIFGATYVVLSPEHKLIKELWSQIENKTEIESYLESVKNKSEIDRTAEGKEKTGIEIRGIFAFNPETQEKIQVWIADYVLGNYGTGAIMAVPAHDVRDGEFARKYNIPTKMVVVPYLIDEHDPPIENKKTVEKKMVQCVIENPKRDKILVLKWEKFNWFSFVSGGIDSREDAKDAALREIREETGCMDIKEIKPIGYPFFTTYHATHKDENRVAEVFVYHVILQTEQRAETSKFENEKFHDLWVSKEEARKMVNQVEAPIIWQFIDGNFNYTGEGKLINSGKFSGMDSEKAKKEITKFLKGKWVTKYKLRDWVFSRQRYWGEPIPVFHDGNMVVAVKEGDLPVKLPNVKSYEPTGTAESPLADIPNWINAKVGGKILRRESNTMPQWAGSSWYYLRYMDPNNSKVLVDKKKEKYWSMVDLYVGGAEHATRHLIYARFWHKFLYDIGAVSTKEPFQKLQNVGLIAGVDGRKMSKRFGNVINPDSIVKTYGADTLRMYEMFMGPFDQGIPWSEENILGVRRFLERFWRYSGKISKKDKTSKKTEALLHQTIAKVSSDIANMAFNTAVSSMMILLNEIERAGISKKDFEQFVKILSPFAPHITSEIWRNLGNKSMLVIESWPKADPKKMQEDEMKIVVQINGKTRGEIMVGVDIEENEIISIAKDSQEVGKWLLGKQIQKTIYVPKKLLNFVI